MDFNFFIRKYWVNLFITTLIILNYLIFHFFLSSFLEKEISLSLFFFLVVLILFPLRELLLSYAFIDFNWDYLIDSEFHHFEFLAKFFTLENLIYRVTPELMIWLKITECRLFILNSDKKSYIMYLFNKGKVENVHLIPKRKIYYLTKIFKKYHNIITRKDNFLEIDERRIFEKFNVYIVVPFYHLNRLMGFISFHNETKNQYVNRALELYATKAAFLIHDEILRKRIQNISKFEEEIKIAEKIRKMLQSSTPPKIPNYSIEIQKIQTATIIEFFEFNGIYFSIILSIPKVNGVSGMILSGKLGYLYSYLQHHRNNFTIKNFLKALKEHKELNLENYPVEILILEFDPEKNYVTMYCDSPDHYSIKLKNKIVKFNYFYRLSLLLKEKYFIEYLGFPLMNFLYNG
ncbi:MAG: hypothetical protein ACK4UJ_11120 [Leptonema sp. (in: bacteria)]